jgi:hypothetical protein
MNSSKYLPYYTASTHNAYGGNEQITEKSSVEDLGFSIFDAVD